MDNTEQTQKELEHFLLQFNQQELTEKIVQEQIDGSLKRLEELQYEVKNICFDLELQMLRMKSVLKKNGQDNGLS